MYKTFLTTNDKCPIVLDIFVAELKCLDLYADCNLKCAVFVAPSPRAVIEADISGYYSQWGSG